MFSDLVHFSTWLVVLLLLSISYQPVFPELFTFRQGPPNVNFGNVTGLFVGWMACLLSSNAEAVTFPYHTLP